MKLYIQQRINPIWHGINLQEMRNMTYQFRFDKSQRGKIFVAAYHTNAVNPFKDDIYIQ